MADFEVLVDSWDEAHREFAIALNGMPDDELWKRPHPRLLSVGEIAAHVAYWEGVKSCGLGFKPDLEKLDIKSPLIDGAARYYNTSVDQPMQLSLGTNEVMSEVKKIHEHWKAAVAELNPDLKDPVVGFQPWTWGAMLQYAAFHVAYHTGQVYSARHIFGHQTEDN